MGDEENKEGKRKGFAGLSSLVSDVDANALPASKPTGTEAGPSTAPKSTNVSSKPLPLPHPVPQGPSSNSSGGKWLLGISVAIGVLWLIWQVNRPSSSASAYTPSTEAPSYTAPSTATEPPPPQVPSSPEEVMPPVGSDLVLSTAQIRYCLAEDIRMDAAKSAVDGYNGSEVDRFNMMVADYNSRCGSFRYRSGALESARRDVEPYRSQFQVDGRQRIIGNRPQSSGSTSTQVDSGIPQVFAAELTYPAGRQGNPDVMDQDSVSSSPDANYGPEREVQSSGDLSTEERSSIELACIIAKSNGPAAYNQCVSSQLQELAAAPRMPSLVALSYDERSAMQLACITRKSDGAAAYNRCLVGQLQELENAPRQPSLAGLSYDEKSAIDLACITTKSDGPASYNRCLLTQLGELQSAPRSPDLSGLTYQERSSIQLACITEKSNGVAAYNRCLVAQLSSIGR